MHKKKFIKILIPARSGSKGIIKKNIKVLKNKPLIDYTIECALKVAEAKDIFLSSDGDEILKLGSKFGINLLKRPSELSQDESTASEFIRHFIEETGNLTHDFTISCICFL